MCRLFIFLSIIFCLNACKQKEILPNTYMSRFYKSQEKLEDLIKSLKQDTSLARKYGESLKWTHFDDITKQKLKELDIDEVHLFSWGRKQRQFDFKTTWRQETPIHIYYNTLDSVTTKNGYYKKDENSNEIWGLGNHWSLWNEIKSIDAKQ